MEENTDKSQPASRKYLVTILIILVILEIAGIVFMIENNEPFLAFFEIVIAMIIVGFLIKGIVSKKDRA